MTTGEKIRSMRIEAQLTQRKVAELSGIAEPTIRKYESNRLNPKISTLKKLADALGCDIAFILPDDMADVYFAGVNRAHDEHRRLREQSAELGGDGEEDRNYTRMVYAYLTLNAEGQKKAAERIEELAEIPKYRNPAASHPPQSSKGGE